MVPFTVGSVVAMGERERERERNGEGLSSNMGFVLGFAGKRGEFFFFFSITQSRGFIWAFGLSADRRDALSLAGFLILIGLC